MADHAHDHDHPVRSTGWRFLILGPLEIAAALVVHSSTVATNGMHDLFDGLYLLGFGRWDDRLAHSLEHSRYCRRRGWLGILSAAITTLVVGVGLLIEHDNSSGVAQMLVAIISGGLGLWFNLGGSLLVKRQGDPHHGGFSSHLLQDAIGSALAIIGGVATYLAGQPLINFWFAVAILAASAAFGARKGLELYQLIRHMEEEHPHHEETPEQHARHSQAASN